MPEKIMLRHAQRAVKEENASGANGKEITRLEACRMREGKSANRTVKQALTIRLSQARRAGVKSFSSKH